MGGLVDLQNTVVNTLLLHNGSKKHLEEYCKTKPNILVVTVLVIYLTRLHLVCALILVSPELMYLFF